MRSLFLMFCLVLSFGCYEQRESPPPQPKGGVEVNAPGVNVEVKKDSGVKVRAPGVNVDVEKKR